MALVRSLRGSLSSEQEEGEGRGREGGELDAEAQQEQSEQLPTHLGRIRYQP